MATPSPGGGGSVGGGIGGGFGLFGASFETSPSPSGGVGGRLGEFFAGFGAGAGAGAVDSSSPGSGIGARIGGGTWTGPVDVGAPSTPGLVVAGGSDLERHLGRHDDGSNGGRTEENIHDSQGQASAPTGSPLPFSLSSSTSSREILDGVLASLERHHSAEVRQSRHTRTALHCTSPPAPGANDESARARLFLYANAASEPDDWLR